MTNAPEGGPPGARPGMPFDYPELGPAHVENARIFARREDLMIHLAPELRGGTVAEVGVMYGDYSDSIIRTLNPKLFVAVDRFRMHAEPRIWGESAAERFQGLTHREFYEKRFLGRGGQVRCEEGESDEVLARSPDATFDMIYIDAAHDYESVRKDADAAKRKIKRDGILVFNDYILYSPDDSSFYGVVPVVNDLVVNQGFEIVGFALNLRMYCDIAIRRRAKKN
jgi:hypothetical protein